MTQLFVDHFRQQAVPCAIWLSAIVLTGSALFGQDSIGFRFTPKDPDLQQAGSRIVTLQEVHHIVPKKALKELEKARRARAERRTGDAICHLNEAIRIDPEFIAARNDLAVIYLTAAKPEPAVAQLEEAVQIDSKNAILFTNLCLGYNMLHKFDAAEHAIRLAVDLNRTGVLEHLFLGLILVAQRKFTEEALQCLERAYDEYPEAHLLAARVLMARGDSNMVKYQLQAYLATSDQKNRAVATRWLSQFDQSD
jgi:tetratricopeptide (TPR) repeat protein